MEYRKLSDSYDAALAALIRTNLKAHHLDIPGTVYFDEGLDHLSSLAPNTENMKDLMRFNSLPEESEIRWILLI